MFCGEYSHNLDAKKRIILPSKLREQLGDGVVMTKSVDRCVALYPVERWNAFTAKLDSLPDIETRQVKRFLYSAAFETSVDGQGRILIAPNLCDYASLTGARRRSSTASPLRSVTTPKKSICSRRNREKSCSPLRCRG